MRFRISAADAETAIELSYEIEANDATDAEKKALASGVLVSNVIVVNAEQRSNRILSYRA